MSRAPSRIRHDYKAMLESTEPAGARPLKWILLLAVAFIAIGLLFLMLFHDAGGMQTQTRSPQPVAAVTSSDLPLPAAQDRQIRHRPPR